LDEKCFITLHGFGLGEINFNQSVSQLSGGQKTKVALIGILLKNADVLFLDEPTNNLDLPALIWLEDFLKNSKATCVMISHDRRFIDHTVSKIFALDWNTHKLAIANGTYSDYLEMLHKQFERQLKQHEEQGEEIERLKETARDLKEKSQKGSRKSGSDNDKMLQGFNRNKAGESGRKAKTIKKRIDKIDRIEEPIKRKALFLNLSAEKGYGNRDIQLKNVIAGFPHGFHTKPISMEIPFGKRIGIIGPNGSGKSTLLKTITGKLPPLSGDIFIGSGLSIGDMMQEHDSLPREINVSVFLQNRLNLNKEFTHGFLGKYGIDPHQVEQKISVLSPGSRARLLIGIFTDLSTNMLILDEPTNHLDLETLDALEGALRTYKGSIILVSHDRYLIESMMLDRIFILDGGGIFELNDFKNYLYMAEEKAKDLFRLL
jgi:ATP-binding cassette subfamily F protein 3